MLETKEGRRKRSHKPGKRQCMGRAKTDISVRNSIHAPPVPSLYLSLSAPSSHYPHLHTFTFHCASLPCKILPPKLSNRCLSLLLQKKQLTTKFWATFPLEWFGIMLSMGLLYVTKAKHYSTAMYYKFYLATLTLYCLLPVLIRLGFSGHFKKKRNAYCNLVCTCKTQVINKSN